VILLFPPKYVLQFVATNNRINIQQQDVLCQEGITKEKCNSYRPNRNDYSRESLKRYLTYAFTENGLKDKLTEAEYTVLNESSWIWNNGNHISKGLWAYIPSTWEGNCKDIGEYEDINPYDQTDCAVRMWKKGEWVQWETWCKKYGVGLKKCEWANL